jgi:4-amino-4-deoxy-L-arabinose transferase-like glycosyltransferase
VLALGAAVGKPGAIPILLAGATAALLFLFGARLAGAGTAFVATALWIAAPANIKWRAAYFSESVTCALWIAWCWTALRYRQHGKRRDLIATSLLAAFAALTRPATAAALALPIPFIVWPRLREAAGRKDALIAGAIGLVLFAAVPVWDTAVLDDWKTVPYTEYSVRTYPFDLPTLNTDWSPAPRELPDDMRILGDTQRKTYEGRTAAVLPGAFVERLNETGKAALPRPLAVLRFLAPIGLIFLGGAGAVALASVGLIIAGHILMPHDRSWTIYYLDVFPVVAFGVVVALRIAAETALARARTSLPLLMHAPLALGGVLLVLAETIWTPPRVADHAWTRRETFFRAGVCALPPGPKIVFVQQRADASPHHSLIDNDPRWETSDTWIVRSWTAERNRALIGAAPERATYFYDEKAGWLARMLPDGTPTREGVVNVLKVDLSAGQGLTCR